MLTISHCESNQPRENLADNIHLEWLFSRSLQSRKKMETRFASDEYRIVRMFDYSPD